MCYNTLYFNGYMCIYVCVCQRNGGQLIIRQSGYANLRIKAVLTSFYLFLYMIYEN